MSDPTWPAVVRPELALLLLCTHRELTGSARDHVTRLAGEYLDWQRLWREATWHGLIPYLHRHHELLSRSGCPDALLREMRAHTAAVAVNNARLLASLRELVDGFDTRGIPTIALKGPVLSLRLFGDLSVRPCGDLDILVQPEDAAKACAALLAMGFSAVDEAMVRWQSEWIRTSYEMQFANDASEVRVDLHWRWYHPHYRFAPHQEEIWLRSGPISLNAGRFRTLDVVDEALFLVLHAARHEWEALRWLVDIAALLRALPVEQWRAVDRRAEQWGVQRMWWTSVVLCEQWLGLTVPNELPRRVESRVNAIAAEASRNWQRMKGEASHPPELPWRTLFYRSLESGSDRRRLLYEFCAKPSARDWSFCALPRALWPLYLVVRPLRALSQQGAAAYKKHLHACSEREPKF